MEDAELRERISENIKSFKGLWSGGYCEGNPLDPMAPSLGYGELGYMSVLHVLYLACIKPYITDTSVVLEIGPGRGTWTKTFLHAREVWCLDAVSAEENKFWEHIGKTQHVRYMQISDYSCSELPNNKFNYLFSFGCFCHIPFGGIREYMKNLYAKLQNGANCFIMTMDFEKYNDAWKRKEYLSVFRVLNGGKKRYLKRLINSLHWLRMHKQKYREKIKSFTYCDINENNIHYPGKLYHAGTKETCDMLERIGYKIVDPDMGVLNRDSLTHFIKP